MIENMTIYDAVKQVPDNAKKIIGAGRLKGMTDINPMWRIQTLTEQFGPVGVGWYYKIVNQWTEDGADGVKCAFVNIELYIKINEEWSAPIEGTGGSMIVSKEKGGLYTSDEAYKMALTDAISVSCKALGVGADVYWAGGRTKYNQKINNEMPFFDNLSNEKLTDSDLAKLNAVLQTLRGHSSQMYNNMLKQIKQKYGTDELNELNKTQCYEIIHFINKQIEKSVKQ